MIRIKVFPHIFIGMLLIGCFLLCLSFSETASISSHLSHKMSTALFDDMTDLEKGAKVNSPITHYEEVSSTMDTAKDVLKNSRLGDQKVPDVFTIVADYQSNGRGTRGRSWKYGTGNLFMTTAIRRTSISIPLHYLPLRVGTLIASAIHPYISDPGSTMSLKWPNDILINSRKVCGILIEMEDDYLLIGIGCNVMEAPAVLPTGSEFGRPSTALVQHNNSLQQYLDSCKKSQADENTAAFKDSDIILSGDVSSIPSSKRGFPVVHRRVAKDIVAKFEEWLASPDSGQSVIADFSRNMDFSEQILRDRYDQPNNRIVPMYLNDDGTLHAKLVHDDSEIDLVAEYLY